VIESLCFKICFSFVFYFNLSLWQSLYLTLSLPSFRQQNGTGVLSLLTSRFIFGGIEQTGGIEFEN
jgi:hypothetical protein